jgi:Zn-dependent alcohol dehydrogenase
MKTLFQTSLKLATVMLLLCGGAAITAHAQGARLQLDQLDSLANKASETVDVKLDERLMATTAKIFSDKDDAEIKEMLKGLKGIYVKSFEFEKAGEYSVADVESVMSQLRGGGWSKIVGVRSKKDGDNVEVYLMMQGDQIQGLAVISAEPKEFTVVNIVGPVNLEKLTKLEGQFGVPDLGLDQPKPKKSKLVP